MSTAESLNTAVTILKDILGSVKVLVEAFGIDLISNFSNLTDLEGGRFLGLNSDMTNDPMLVLGEKASIDIIQQWIKDVNYIHLQDKVKGWWGAVGASVLSTEHVLSQLQKLKGYNPSVDKDKDTASNASNSRPTTASSTQYEV